MKNYFKFSILSLVFAMTGILFTSCDTESSEESIQETATKTEIEEKATKLVYNASGINVTEVSREPIAIKGVASNLYVSSENGIGSITLSRTQIGTWETFTMITFDTGQVTFIGNNNKYLNGTSGFYAPGFNSTSFSPINLFEIDYDDTYDAYGIKPFISTRYLLDKTECPQVTSTIIPIGYCISELGFGQINTSNGSSINERTAFEIINL
ncbi:hypothetical protein GCM10022393_35860 [Aquimarina addita]|uniref:Lipoprotein n=1 Tax=Aquimarina addita TaxID=870485 RepID=A0ABP6USC3_9FLAO